GGLRRRLTRGAGSGGAGRGAGGPLCPRTAAGGDPGGSAGAGGMAPAAADAACSGPLARGAPGESGVTLLDWLVVALYLGASLALGLWVARRGAKNMAEFFVGGRAIPWWLAATSMAATTFNVDTPLYVAGVVARRGVAGNWEWWCFALAHVLLAV